MGQGTRETKWVYKRIVGNRVPTKQEEPSGCIVLIQCISDGSSGLRAPQCWCLGRSSGSLGS